MIKRWASSCALLLVACGPPDADQVVGGLLNTPPPGHEACPPPGAPHRVSGTVVNPEGDPIPDAVVGAISDCGARYSPVATTSAEGTFEAFLPHPAPLALLDWRADDDPPDRRADAVGTPALTAPPLCPRVVGVVDGAGNPVIGMRVAFGRGFEETRVVHAPPHAPGVPTGPDGKATVLAECTGVIPWLRKGGVVRQFEVGPAGRLVLVEGGLLQGTVLDAAGAPMPGTIVRVTAKDDVNVSVRARTDPAGAWAIEVPAGLGEWLVSAYMPDGLHAFQTVLGPQRPTDRVRADFTAPPTRTLTLGCAGMPGDRCVTIDADGLRCETEGAWLAGPAMVLGGCRHHLYTGTEPRTECTCPTSTAVISAGTKRVTIPTGHRWAWLDLRTGYATVKGTVVTPPDQPVTECEVRLLQDMGDASLAVRTWGPFAVNQTTRPGPDGSFQWAGVAPARWNVLATCGRHVAKHGPFDVSDGVMDIGTLDAR